MAYLLSRRARLERQRRAARLAAGFAFGLTAGSVAWIVGTELSIFDTTTRLLIFVLGGITAGVVLSNLFVDEIDFLLRALGIGGIDRQVSEFRYDRQLDLIRERLKKLEVLRTLDPEALLRKSEFIRETAATASLFERNSLARMRNSR